MHTVVHHGVPGAVACRTVLLGLQETFLNAPAHAVEEEGGTRQLLPAVVGRRHHARVPQSVLALTCQDGLAHQQEVLLQLLVVFVFLVQLVHHAHQSRIHPSVATAPVAVLSVGRLVGCHVVGVAPPQAFLHVEQAASQRVAAPQVHLHGVVDILALASHLVHLGIERHGHLNGVNPCPPAVELVVGLGVGGFHLVVQVQLHHGDFLVAPRLHVAVHVSLSAALVVGVVGLHAVAWCPFVEVGPAVGIVDVARVGVYLVKGHQSLIVDGTRPQRTGSDPVHVGRYSRVAVLGHEVIVSFSQRLHHVVGCLCHARHEAQQGCHCQNYSFHRFICFVFCYSRFRKSSSVVSFSSFCSMQR